MRVFSNSIFLAILALVIFIGSSLDSYAQDSYSISAVEFVGNQRIDASALKAQLKIQSGQISSDEISEEVKSLYKTGFFDQVTASIVSSTSGVRVLRCAALRRGRRHADRARREDRER